MRKLATIAVMATAVVLPVAVQAQTAPDKAAAAAQRAADTEENKRLGSLHLRCDGEPNNMSGTESFARLVGAVSLLALFAPPVESPDPAKRLFGEKGVEACSRLIDAGEKRENNGLRRIPLILARAAHRIEAKDYTGALTDVEMARGEAQALGLVGNPYFDRSTGLSFDAIAAEARLRQGGAEAAADAQKIAARGMSKMRFNFYALLFGTPAEDFAAAMPPEVEAALAARARLYPGFLGSYADRLEEVGRFSEAAEKRLALSQFTDGFTPDSIDSWPHARAALSLALAGDWTRAETAADFARSNLEKRRQAGKPENDAATTVETLDLYDIVKLTHGGALKEARRNFAARSQWVNPGFGAVTEVSRRLRAGASSEERFGALAMSPQQLWEKRRDASMAQELQKDTDNKTLFNAIRPYSPIGEYEAVSKAVWRTDKSQMLGKEPDKTNGMWTLSSYSNIPVRFDALVLHAALQARAKGKDGFEIILPVRPQYPAFVRFVSRGDPQFNEARFIAATDAVEQLSQLIPSPADLAARKAPKKRTS